MVKLIKQYTYIYIHIYIYIYIICVYIHIYIYIEIEREREREREREICGRTTRRRAEPSLLSRQAAIQTQVISYTAWRRSAGILGWGALRCVSLNCWDARPPLFASACGSERRTSLEGPRLLSCDRRGIQQTTQARGVEYRRPVSSEDQTESEVPSAQAFQNEGPPVIAQRARSERNRATSAHAHVVCLDLGQSPEAQCTRAPKTAKRGEQPP